MRAFTSRFLKLFIPSMLAWAAAGIIWAAPSHANEDTTDLVSMTCAEFAEIGDEEAPLILAWLDGWMAAQTGRQTIPPEWLGDLAILVGGYCAKHPNEPLHKALEPME